MWGGGLLSSLVSQTAGAADGVSFQVMAIIVSLLVVVGGVAVAFGVLRQQVTSGEKANDKLEARVKVQEDGRVSDAFERGVLTQRVIQLESGQGRVVADLASVEHRFTAQINAATENLIGHIDALRADVRAGRRDREDSKTHRMSDLAGDDDDSGRVARPRGRNGG